MLAQRNQISESAVHLFYLGQFALKKPGAGEKAPPPAMLVPATHGPASDGFFDSVITTLVSACVLLFEQVSSRM